MDGSARAIGPCYRDLRPRGPGREHPAGLSAPRLASYSIQYGLGKDRRCDVERIAREIADAHVIALQEVERFWWRPGMVDQPRELDTSIYRISGKVLSVGASPCGGGSGRKGLQQVFSISIAEVRPPHYGVVLKPYRTIEDSRRVEDRLPKGSDRDYRQVPNRRPAGSAREPLRHRAITSCISNRAASC